MDHDYLASCLYKCPWLTVAKCAAEAQHIHKATDTSNRETQLAVKFVVFWKEPMTRSR